MAFSSDQVWLESLSIEFSRIRKITKATTPLAMSHMETWIAFCEMAYVMLE
jgi:hypothetical protein